MQSRPVAQRPVGLRPSCSVASSKLTQSMNNFRTLKAYTNAKDLVKQVYAFLKQFPREEQYALCDQLRRAVISIPSNIAEGSGRMSAKDQAHFYSIAYGSLMEVLAQLDVACDLGYITNEEFKSFEIIIDEEAKMLTGLINKRKAAL